MNSISALKQSVSLRIRRSMGWVAVCQMTSTNDLQGNIDQAAGLVKGAADKGADVVFLPEAFDFIGESGKQTLEMSQDLGGSTISQFKRLAEANNVWLSLGGFHLKEKPDETKISNTHLLIDSQGNLVETYKKTHLFDVEIPGKFRLKESDYAHRGNSVPAPIETPVGKVGLSICYDLRFPELSLGLRSLGAEILTFPSAFTVATGMAHWKPLLQARAIENQCYVIAAAQTGKHNAKRSSYGHAMIIDPWGTVITECREGVNFALAEIDLEYLRNIRTNMPVDLQRRPDLYGTVALKTKTTDLPEPQWIFNFGHAKVFGHSVIHKSGLTVLFVNKKPVVPGHLLVSPLRSVKSLQDLNPAEVCDLFMLVQQAERFLMERFGTDSCTISIQDGPLAGQTVAHLHVHLLPRREGDFKNNDDVYRELEEHDKVDAGWRSEEDMAEEAKEFRTFWNHVF